MTPDELALRVATHMHSEEGTAPAWDLVIDDVGVGRARVSMIVKDDMLNGLRVAHGGMIFALADTALAYASCSRNEAAVSQQASIYFVSPAQPGERLTAEAQEESSGPRSGIYTVRVTGENGRSVAVFQGLSRRSGRPIIETEAHADTPPSSG